MDDFKTILIKASQDDNERIKLMAAAGDLLAQRLPEVSSVRSIFAVDQLDPGEPARYEIDFALGPAIVLPALGAIPQHIVEGQYLDVPTFPISTHRGWLISQAQQGRTNVVERARQNALDSITKQEETAGWAIIRAAISGDNTTSVATESGFTKKCFSRLLEAIEARKYTPTRVFIPTLAAAEMREWATDLQGLPDDLKGEVFTTGFIGRMFGVDIFRLPSLADTEAYAFDTTQFGIMPVRQPVKSLDDPTMIRELKMGFVAWEEVGFASVVSAAVEKLTISRT